MKTESIVDTFSEILQGISPAQKPEKGKCILSYRFPVKVRNVRHLAHQLVRSDNPAFYFEKHDENYRFLAVGCVHRVRSAGEGRFEDLEQEVSRDNSLIVHNFNGTPDEPFPLYVGSMSFYALHSDIIWKDFYPSDWFIPEFVIAETAGKIVASFQVNLSGEGDGGVSVGKLKEFFARLDQECYHNDNKQYDYRYEKSSEEQELWKNKAANVINAIRQGEVNKLVLSRRVKFSVPEAEHIIGAILKAGDKFPNSYLFMMRSNDSLFIGISPEKLVSSHRGKIHCQAIAGSIVRGDTLEDDKSLGDELLNSKKNREEHRVVVNHISSILEKYCIQLAIDPEPALKKMSYIQHLYTGVSGELTPGVSLFRILKDLHPTPAVGGYPLKPALNMIQNIEQYDRGLYTGFLGWFDTDGNGDFCVALRSALHLNKTLYAFVGSGIMGDSNPADELEETEIKLNAIISLLDS